MSAVATAPRRGQAGRRVGASGSIIDQQRRKYLIPFVGPAFLFYTLLFILPAAGAFWVSLNQWAGSGPMKFVGLRNYVKLFSDRQFLSAFTNTLLLLFVAGSIIFIIAFALTMVLRTMVGGKIVRSVVFFPHLVNALVFGVLAGFLFNPNGLVNTFLGWFGVHTPPLWLAKENLLPLILATIVFTTTGYYTTIIMAGVDRIPTHLYEDCALSGANPLQRLWHVVIPLTWDVFGTCAVLWTLSSIKIFEIIWVFGSGSDAGIPPVEAWTSAVYTYVTAFSGQSTPDFGKATASAIISLLLVSVLVVLLRRVFRREVIEF